MKANRRLSRGHRACCFLTLAVLVGVPVAGADILDHWTTNQISTNSFSLDFVIYGDNRYVAYGSYLDWGATFSSEDGRSWTPRYNGTDPMQLNLSFARGLVYAGGRFFALGGFGTTGISSNGIDWTVILGPTADNAGAAYGASTYVVVGNGWVVPGQTNLAYSADAIIWSPPSYSQVPAGVGLVDVAFGGNRFVALPDSSDPGHCYVSPNGAFWFRSSIPGGGYRHISFANGLFIVPWSAGTNLLSADGGSWTPVNTGITNGPLKVSYANGLFMARAGNYLVTSKDGTNWTQYAHPLPGAARIVGYSIATDGIRLVTLGNDALNGGASFNGYVYLSDELVDVRMTNTAPPGVVVSGLVGRNYQIQSTETLTGSGSNDWQTNITLQLPGNPYVWTDQTATNSQRFYRAVLMP